MGKFVLMYECVCGFECMGLSPTCSGSKCTWHKQEVQTTNIYPYIETLLSWQGGYGEYLCVALQDFWSLWLWCILEGEVMNIKYAQLWWSGKIWKSCVDSILSSVISKNIICLERSRKNHGGLFLCFKSMHDKLRVFFMFPDLIKQQLYLDDMTIFYIFLYLIFYIIFTHCSDGPLADTPIIPLDRKPICSTARYVENKFPLLEQPIYPSP